MSKDILLKDTVVVLSPGTSTTSFLDYSTAELARYLKITGAGSGRIARGNTKLGRSQIAIELTPKATGKSPEAFEISPATGSMRTNCIRVRANTAKGLTLGITELIKGLKPARGGLVWQRGHLKETPANEVRGMYAHMHWAYKRPYSVRAWTLADWKRYIDLLAFFGTNRLQIWTMPDIMPYPLPKGDVQFLERLHEAIEYAKHCRGMFVCVGGCANTIGRPDAAQVPIEKRDYFRAEWRLNPASKSEMNLLMRQREQIYKILNNADAVWIIDSDPGGYPGSTIDEFVEIFIRTRTALNHCRSEARIDYWMWAGWTNFGRFYGQKGASTGPGWEETLKKLKKRLPEPWGILACLRPGGGYAGHVEVVEKLNLVDRTVIYPYGAVEAEPNYPLTEWSPELSDEILSTNWNRKGYRGVQCNAQTPLVQLPNFFHFQKHALEGTGNDARSSLLELGEMISPSHKTLLADCWEKFRLKSPCTNPTILRRLARRLDLLIDEPHAASGALARLGIVEVARLATDLKLQLLAHATRAELADSLKKNRVSIEKATEYLAACISWWRRHEYREPRAWRPARAPYASRLYRNAQWRLDPALALTAWRIGEARFDRLRRDVRCRLIKEYAIRGYEADSAWASMLGQPAVSMPDVK